MSNVISMSDKLEKWNRIFISKGENFSISASSYGRLSFHFCDDQGHQLAPVRFDTVESVKMMSDMSIGMETALDCLYERENE
jgi:hypothetical protein